MPQVHTQVMDRRGIDLTFEDRYPALNDVIPQGGVPGLEYALVHANEVGRRQMDGWDMTIRRAITIRMKTGPRAGDHPAFLMCRGTPIDGAAHGGSIRPYSFTRILDEATGLGPAKPPSPAKSTTKE